MRQFAIGKITGFSPCTISNRPLFKRRYLPVVQIVIDPAEEADMLLRRAVNSAIWPQEVWRTTGIIGRSLAQRFANRHTSEAAGWLSRHPSASFG